MGSEKLWQDIANHREQCSKKALVCNLTEKPVLFWTSLLFGPMCGAVI